MHLIQTRLLKLIDQQNIGKLTLRQIGDLVDEKLPQKIKHHLSQLELKGFIVVDRKGGKISRASSRSQAINYLASIPVLGSANCGPATIYADQNIEGYLKISKRLTSTDNGTYAIKAQGTSMNKANIGGKNIEPGDFIIVDSKQIVPNDGDYILAVIDGMANIKKYRLDRKNKRIALLAESTQNFNPIFIHENDDFRINGKVIDVIKKFEV